MNIGVVGSGNIGASAARLFAQAGHDVAISNSRGPDSLQNLVADIGPNVRAATVEEATDFGEVVFVAIPFFAYETLPAEPLTGKVVVDATNYYEGRDGQIDFGGLTSSELLARHLPDARLVRAFNTMYYETLANEGRTSEGEDRLVLFLAGDGESAKVTVSELIEEIGFDPVDTGSLRDSGKQEPGSPVYNEPMTEDQARKALSEIG